MQIVVLIPTYNEAENISQLIEALQVQFAKLAHSTHILVIDDNSPDGTAEIVKELQHVWPNVLLLPGQKGGLGAAYIRGMRYALKNLAPDVIFEMDGDFSHNPEDIPRLMNAIENGADFVIGSRYVAGGSIPREWHLMRRLISRYGNLVARYISGIYEVRDCTAGFRAIRADLLRKIQLSKLKVQGYAFQVALLYEAKLHVAKIVEVPVAFIDRSKGQSKLGLPDIVEFIINAWWLRFRSSATFIKFLLVGASGVIVNLGTFTLLLFLGVNKYVASPIAIEASVLTNFLMNYRWTFRWRRTRESVQVKGLKFNAVSILALGVSYGTFVLVSKLRPDLPPQLSQLIGILPATLVNYFLNSYWTFRYNPK